jgi:hypothetical protein
MNRSSWKFWVVTTSLAWCCSGASRAGAEDAAAITLDRITRRVTEWRNSFVNVRAVWELRSLPETQQAVDEWPPPPDPETAPLFARCEWIWADHGLNLLEDWFFFYEDGTSKVHSIDAFNGPKGIVFRAHFQKPSADEPEKYVALQMFGLGVGKPISHISIDPAEGLYWAMLAEWLPEVLSKWKWTLETVEDVGGQPCARIAARRDERMAFDVLWLDLDHDCLVRRHRYRGVNGQWAQGRDFIVDEFQRLDAGIWFPKLGRSQLGSTPHENHLIVVTEATVNESVDLARFDPPAPRAGTGVADNVGYFGRASAGPAERRSRADQPPSATANAAAVPRRTAASAMASWVWWSAALVSVSIVFLGAGFWFSRHSQENRS